MKTAQKMKGQQSGFTLIELIVVIVVLGILAATALPRFLDVSKDARVAKMQAAQAAIQTAMSLGHSGWLVKNGANDGDGSGSDSTNSPVVMEGATVAMIGGYPDVGGDGGANAVTDTSLSGILVAAGGLKDYKTDADVLPAPVTSANVIHIYPDQAHADAASATCRVTYTEATQAGAAPYATTAAPIVAIDVSDCS